MKRLILALLLIALLVACTQPQTVEYVFASPAPTAEPEAVEVSLEPVPTKAAPTVATTDMPEETRSPEPTEAPKAQSLYVGATNVTPTDSLELPITIKEIDWEKLSAGKQYETKFYNETVNFQNLRMTVISFASGESGTQFTLRLDLPDEWTDLQCLSMNPCFGFRFYLDEKSQNDFRLVDQFPIMSETLAVSRCNSVTMTYRSDTVTDTVMHAAHEWKIVPFFCFRKMFGGSNYNDHPGGQLDLEQDEVVRFNGTEKAYYPGTIGVTELPALSVQLPI
ncbi:MAG: hypothetical protein IJL59_07405, partial [Clostridia bacterium]|nr:hypothetical protein [Clostridia bacterium]